MQHLDYKTHVAPSVNKVASCVGRAGGSMWTERSTCGRESNRWGCIRCGRVWVGNRGSLPTSFPPSLFPSGRVTFRPTSPRFRIFALGIEWTCLAFKCWPIAPYKTVSSSSNNSFKQPKTSTQTHPQTIKHKKQQHKSNKRAKTRKKTKENQRKQNRYPEIKQRSGRVRYAFGCRCQGAIWSPAASGRRLNYTLKYITRRWQDVLTARRRFTRLAETSDSPLSRFTAC